MANSFSVFLCSNCAVRDEQSKANRQTAERNKKVHLHHHDLTFFLYYVTGAYLRNCKFRVESLSPLQSTSPPHGQTEQV